MRPNYRVSSLAVLLIACGSATEGPRERANQTATDSQASSSCLEATSTGGWLSGSIGSEPQSHFMLELDATPNTSNEDSLFGLAHAEPSTYSDLAAIVRFNPDGKIDARDADAYRAVTDVPYVAAQPYHLSFDVDTYHHTYSLLATNGSDGGYIAQNFAYRSEQANADGLSFFGLKVDDGGPLDVCNVNSVTQICTSTAAGDGFVNLAFPAQSTFVKLEFDATPGGSNVDTVLGVSRDAISEFNDIAVAVRFNPDGRIDARDGDAYREVDPNMASYVAGQSYHFELFIDIVGHTYVVVVNHSNIGQNFAFRSQQAFVESLGNFVVEADAGSVSDCSLAIHPADGAIYVHPTSDTKPVPPNIVPLSSGRFLSSDDTQTVLYDPTGFVTNQTLPFPGPLASDAAGEVYRTGVFSGTVDEGTGPLTSAGGNDAFIVKYDQYSLRPVWSKRFGGTNDDTVGPPIVNARGDVLVVLDGALMRLDANGNVVYDSVAVPANAHLALDPNGNVFTNADDPSSQALAISKLDPNGNPLWTQTMPFTRGGGEIEAIAADTTGGVVFAGEIDGLFAFPDGSLFGIEAGEDGDETFVAKLDANGARVYASGTNSSDFEGLAVDGLGNAAVSGTHTNGFDAALDEFGPTGAPVRSFSETLLGQTFFGLGRMPVIADPAGPLYWALWIGPGEYPTFFVKLDAP